MQTSPQNSISRSTRNRNINHAVKQKCLLKWSTSETVESTLETLPACHATWPGVHTERTATEGALWWLGQKSARIHLGQWIYRFYYFKEINGFLHLWGIPLSSMAGGCSANYNGPTLSENSASRYQYPQMQSPQLGGGVSQRASERLQNLFQIPPPRRFYGPWNLVSVGVEAVQEWISHGYRGPTYLEVVAS